MIPCEMCGGSGMLTLTATCQRCNGMGELSTFDDDGNENLEICNLCEDGLTYTEVKCDACDGTGVV